MNTQLYAVPLALVALAVAAFIGVAFAENIDPFSNNSQFAWSENAGWLNAEPANCNNCGVQVSKTGLTGYIWSENLGWINLSCKNSNTCAGPGGNWGVTNNGSGALSGYAWAENAGWISFSCANLGSCGTVNYGVTISGTTGVFSGYAWGENIGWISFSDSAPVAYQVQTSDDDGDGVFAGSDNCPRWPNPSQALPDWVVPAGDSDCDAFTDTSEAFSGTDPAAHCAADSTRNNEPLPDHWPADFNDDQFVSIIDVSFFSGIYGSHSPGPPYLARFDFNGDGIVNIIDVSRLSQVYAKHCA